MRIISDKAGWRDELSSVSFHDFYHTYEYHMLDYSGEPYLFVFEYENQKLLLPLLLRPISGTPYSDLTSVYGYVGCLYNTLNPDENLLEMFRSEFTAYVLDNNIVSLFNRSHPLIPNSLRLPRGMGEVTYLNKTIALDTLRPETMQVAEYASTLRRQLFRISQSGVTCRMGRSIEDWAQFSMLYNQTMERKKASPGYFFDSSYFLSFRQAREFESVLILAEYDGKCIGGILCVITQSVMQYHLGAVDWEYMSLSPLKLLIDEARKLATERRLFRFHLGGGLGCQKDGLYQFKSRFSHNTADFYTWKWVISPEIYQHLSQGITDGRFPLYRNMR